MSAVDPRKADFTYAPLYMSCFGLDAPGQAQKLVDGFMSRLLEESGPILGSMKKPRLAGRRRMFRSVVGRRVFLNIIFQMHLFFS